LRRLDLAQEAAADSPSPPSVHRYEKHRSAKEDEIICLASEDDEEVESPQRRLLTS
jgi:hypothetical protein